MLAIEGLRQNQKASPVENPRASPVENPDDPKASPVENQAEKQIPTCLPRNDFEFTVQNTTRKTRKKFLLAIEGLRQNQKASPVENPKASPVESPDDPKASPVESPDDPKASPVENPDDPKASPVENQAEKQIPTCLPRNDFEFTVQNTTRKTRKRS